MIYYVSPTCDQLDWDEDGPVDRSLFVWATDASEASNPILLRLSDALDVALDDAHVRTRLRELGCDIPDRAQRGPQPLAALVKSEIARWTPIIKGAKS